MRERIVFILGAGFLAAFLFLTGSVSLDAGDEILPQAEPVASLFKSVKQNDLEKFKSAYSERMKQEFMEEFDGSWEEVLADYSSIIKEGLFGGGSHYGDYNMEDFRFEYSGSDTKGIVTIYFKDKFDGEMDVVKEEDGWKIDEK